MNLERKMKEEENKQFFDTLGITMFAIFMILGMILGFIIALRPTVSDVEKRELTKFPEFSLGEFLEGNYTSQINTWYADTYPFRDSLISGEQRIQLAYGIRTDSIQHIGQGDDIPDIPLPTAPTTPPGTDPTNPGPTEQPTERPSEQPTEQPTERPTQPQTEFVDDGRQIADMNPVEAGDVNVKDLVGYCVYGFNLKAANLYCDAVASMASKLSGKGIRVYEMMIPNNSGVLLDDATKSAWKLIDEQRVINYYYGKTLQTAPEVIPVDAMGSLLAHKTEYIYFKTDHHWTQLGAYYGYQAFCNAAGFTPNPLSFYHTEVMEYFVGSYVNTNALKQLEANADSITYYFPIATNELRFYDAEQNGFRTGKAIRNMSPYHPRYGYMGFIYGDNSISYMTNPGAANGRSCLVIKESFGNCFAPFLIDHYEKVVIVDYRLIKESIVDVAVREGVTDVLFINNLEAISDSNTMTVLFDRCQ